MIKYSASSSWDLLRWRGSVAPRSLRWAVPCSGLAVLYYHILHTWTDWYLYFEAPNTTESTGWGMFTFILGFLVVFRARLSYSRYWEGITLVEQACGVWLNGCSNLFAFCSTAPEKQVAVAEFQYVLSRLASLLVCYSMCDISSLDRSRFPHLEVEGLEVSSLAYLEATTAKQNVALQWMQRLVVENARSGVIDIAPPILSRVFQEFSIGIVHFIDANKISTVPFPFVFAQTVWGMLAFASLVPLPLLLAIGMSAAKAAAYTFLIVFAFWSVHFIAVEIELPFGDDCNDLPLDQVNKRFNRVLQRLLDAKAQQTPRFVGSIDPHFDVVALRSNFSGVSTGFATQQHDRAGFFASKSNISSDSGISQYETTAPRQAVREMSSASDVSRTTMEPTTSAESHPSMARVYSGKRMPLRRSKSPAMGALARCTTEDPAWQPSTLAPCVEAQESHKTTSSEGEEEEPGLEEAKPGAQAKGAPVTSRTPGDAPALTSRALVDAAGPPRPLYDLDAPLTSI